jgi:hypothetical protein
VVILCEALPSPAGDAGGPSGAGSGDDSGSYRFEVDAVEGRLAAQFVMADARAPDRRPGLN